MHQQKMKVHQCHMIQLLNSGQLDINMKQYALAFSITEEAEEDGQYGSIASRYTKALARSLSSY